MQASRKEIFRCAIFFLESPHSKRRDLQRSGLKVVARISAEPAVRPATATDESQRRLRHLSTICPQSKDRPRRGLSIATDLRTPSPTAFRSPCLFQPVQRFIDLPLLRMAEIRECKLSHAAQHIGCDRNDVPAVTAALSPMAAFPLPWRQEKCQARTDGFQTAAALGESQALLRLCPP